MACLDTCFLVDLAGGGGRRRQGVAADVLRRLVEQGEALCTTRFSVAELFVGVYRAEDVEAETAKIRALLEIVEIIEFGETEALIFGRITAHLQEAGRPAGDMDVLIAATAIAGNHVLITENVAHFRDIPGLKTVSYTAVD